MRYSDLPAWAGTGRSVTQLSSHRVDAFEDIPEPLRSYIRINAPMWMSAPKDEAEIKSLQQ